MTPPLLLAELLASPNSIAYRSSSVMLHASSTSSSLPSLPSSSSPRPDSWSDVVEGTSSDAPCWSPLAGSGSSLWVSTPESLLLAPYMRPSLLMSDSMLSLRTTCASK